MSATSNRPQLKHWDPPTIRADGTADYDARHWVSNDRYDLYTHILQPLPAELRDLAETLERDFEWCGYDVYFTYSYGELPGVEINIDHDCEIVHINADPADSLNGVHAEINQVVDWVIEVFVSTDRYEGALP